MKPYLAAAYNMDLRCLHEYKNCGIDEIFAGASFPTNFGSGRLIHLYEPILYDKLGEHFQEAKRLGIKTTFLFNPACSGGKEWKPEGMHEIINVARFLNAFTVDYLVLSHPFLVNVFRRLCPDLKIKISSHYNVDNISKFKLFLECLDVDVVTVSQFANKNFTLLRTVVEAYGPHRLEILCSVPCIAGCPFRAWHAMSFAHANEADIVFRRQDSELKEHFPPCLFEMALHPNVLMSSMFVRREDLKYYQDLGINRFKIGERMYPTAHNIACARYYSHKMRKPSKQFIDFLFRSRVAEADLMAMDGFYEPFFNGDCDGTKYNCDDCGHCSDYSTKVFEIKKELLQLSNENYQKDYFGKYARYLEKLTATFKIT